MTLYSRLLVDGRRNSNDIIDVLFSLSCLSIVYCPIFLNPPCVRSIVVCMYWFVSEELSEG